ncbi:Sec-independent protein translocase protein TatB [Sorangium sp. So ce1182]|uniref:Sec-independent protein translocase protein TatB n=1 Tax=Sorangium sp. So ce1182 TaxID=3133334 RepID=UPI003F636721
MFGFSFGEIVVLIVVGVVVVGPRRLPAMMRTAGGWVSKLRRMTTELRTQSGIDDLIRQEGLEREIRELRSLSRVNVIETLVTPVRDAMSVGTVVSATPRVRPPEPEPAPPPPPPDVKPLREREYPVLGCDAYGAELDAEADGATKAAEASTGAASATTASATTPATADTAATAGSVATAGTAEPAATAGAAATEPAPTTASTTAPEAAAATQGAAESGAAS